MADAKLTNVCMLGKLPPPVGGVTISIKNLMAALASKNISASIFTPKQGFNRFDLAHIHYSNLLKRLLGVLVAKLFAKRVIFTVHGKFLDMSNRYNRLSVKLADGFIVLNQRLYDQVLQNDAQSNCALLPSIFKEGFEQQDDGRQYFTRETGRKYLLLYAGDRNHRDGEEVYGVSFVLQNLAKLPADYHLVLLDLSGKFAQDASEHAERLVYINEVVNFTALLEQVDLYLRPTYMDGASIAVQEALMLGVPVVATDVVDRPEGTLTYPYKDSASFVKQVLNAMQQDSPGIELQSVDDYIQFCQTLLLK